MYKLYYDHKNITSISLNLPLMDTPTTGKKSILIKGFVATKQVYLFDMLKKRQFSGELVLVNPAKGKWHFYIYLGRILYATGGDHSVRRWRRNLTAHIPNIAANRQFLEKELHSISNQKVKFCWEYELISRWLSQGKATREQVMKMITGVLTEIFFDLSQVGDINFYLNNEVKIVATNKLLPFDARQVIPLAWKQWQLWIKAKLGDRSPNRAAIIKQPEQLKLSIPAKTYVIFNKLLNGKNTLRDLSITFKRDLASVGALLLPHLQQGSVELVAVPDLPSPVQKTPVQNQNAPLIACIDDSPMICQTMGEILTPKHRFLGITEPLKAISEVIKHKPDLIFLDLMMPQTNGYEICSSLRKLNFFRQTPIVIVTSNDGMIHRMRTKMMGATDFMAKPVKPTEVINMVNKYLTKEKAES